jgi:23S rRNA pseudouridine1911/1915/1917 synthase
MANIGNPILGDRKYGTHHEIGRSALHAAVLGFAHPRTGKYVQFESPVPEDINRLL